MLTRGRHHGHAALWLENDLLRVGLLPEKGADIFELTSRPEGVQLLMESPSGLRPPSGRLPEDFLENYEGGWQELFPNHGDACTFHGRMMPMHGEVALLPWEAQVLEDNPQKTTVNFKVHCRKAPLVLERTMRVRSDLAVLEILSRVTNDSGEECEFVWGHHLTFGESFLREGSTLDLPAERLFTPDPVYEPATARLAPGQAGPWPWALGRDGSPVDLRRIGRRELHSHDDAYLTGLARGHFSLTSPSLKLRFSLDWDARLFPWVILWQPYGGAELPPLTGMYGVGIEPWSSRYPLDEASRRGEAHRLAGHQSLETRLAASIEKL